MSTAALRLLMVASGRAGFPAPPLAPTPISSTAVGPSNAVGWGDLPAQQAVAHYHDGRTYYAYNKANGNTGVRYYDHSDETWSDETDLGFIEADWGHASPNLLVRESDKRIIVAYSAHNATALYQRISTNPADISSFGAATDLAAQLGAGHFTYWQLQQLRDVANDPIFLIGRNEAKGAFSKTASEWSYSISTDGGATWAAKTVFWKITNQYSYLLSSKTSETRIDFVASDGAHGATTNLNLWHFYYDGSAGTWHKTDGTQITNLPFDTSDATRLYDGSGGNEGAIPAGVSAGGGQLAAVFRVFPTYDSPQDQRYWWARWNGSAWQAQELAANGEDQSWGMVAIDPENSSQLWMGREIDSILEMARWTSDDDGESWTEEQYPSSGESNIHVVPVREGVSPVRVMWIRGLTVPIGAA